MLELLVLISGLVALYRFSKTTRAVAQGAEVKTQVWAEDAIKEATLQRADNYEDWKTRSKGKAIVTHDQFMAEMQGYSNTETK